MSGNWALPAVEVSWWGLGRARSRIINMTTPLLVEKTSVASNSGSQLAIWGVWLILQKVRLSWVGVSTVPVSSPI